MERARHRFRSVLPEVGVTNRVEMDKPRDTKTLANYTLFTRNFTTWNSYSVKQLLVTWSVICLCLVSNLESVVSAEVGVGGQENSDSGFRTFRPILHRGSDALEKVPGSEIGNGRSAGGESVKIANVTRDIPEGKDLSEKKHSNRASINFNCKNCGNSSTTSGNGRPKSHHLAPAAGEDTHKIESILREIFLDELEDNAFEDDDDEVEVTHDHHISGHSDDDADEPGEDKLSRRGRSEPEVTSSFFPEGRAFQGEKAKGTRSAPGEKGANKRSGGKSKKKSSKASTDLTKYNEYMDAVFNRMNTMIKKKRMDPLRVNLYAGPSKAGQKKKNNKNSNKGKNSGSGKTSQKHSPRMDLDSEEEEDPDEEIDTGNGPARKDVYLQVVHDNEDHEDGPLGLDEEESEESVNVNHDEATVRKIRALLENAGNSSSSLQEPQPSDSDSDSRGNESKPKKPKGSSVSKGNRPSNKSKDKGQKGSNGNKKNKNSQSQESQQKDKNKNKNKKQAHRSKPTRGILHGLSSLKRDGNVAVIRQGDKVRVVRANFLLGPVSLEILPKKSKANDDKPVAATATAPKLKGILEVRLKKGAPTSIRKLRVYPPKSVKVDGAGGGSVGTSGGGKRKGQQYGKVTPMATARLRQIASTVVRQTDNKRIQPTSS